MENALQNLKGLKGLLDFLKFLDRKKIQFKLEQQQDTAIMVSFALVGKRVEVEFFEHEIQFSVFHGNEDVDINEKALFDLIAENWD